MSPQARFYRLIILIKFITIGKHIVQLFVQFAPYNVAASEGSWTDPAFTNSFAERVIKIVEEYAPG